MKNFLVSSIKNPLAPFILLLALIILMTIIISNIKSARETAHAHTGRQSLLFDPQPEETDETGGTPAASEPDIRHLTAPRINSEPFSCSVRTTPLHFRISEHCCITAAITLPPNACSAVRPCFIRATQTPI